MQSSQALEEMRDEALRKLGRNVVNFHRMERLLKGINAWNGMSSRGDTFRKNLRRRIKALSKRSMGRLVNEFFASLASKPSEEEIPLDETQVSISIEIKEAREARRERQRALRRLVSERNALIHRRLSEFDPDSIESCNILCKYLDEQNTRIIVEMEELNGVVAKLREFLGTVAELGGVDKIGEQD